MAQRPYIVGNWKMNGTRAMLSEARAIDRAAARYPDVDVALAPPFTLIAAMREAAETMTVGAQDCHGEAGGAFTGNISAPILADAGADFTIVGHSERRAMHRESDSHIRTKSEAALEAGFTAAGVSVRLTGPIPTPGVAYLTRALRLAAGVVISASHNPYYDNGIKFFSAQGSKLDDATEQQIEDQLEQPFICGTTRYSSGCSLIIICIGIFKQVI